MKLLSLWLEVHGFCAAVECIINVLQLWASSISDGTWIQSESLSGSYFTNLLFQRIRCLAALTSLQTESKLDLKIQIPPHQDPDFITVLYRKSVTCSSGEQGCNFWFPAISLLGALFINSMNGKFRTISF